ncbi:MAG: hypothetical protein G8345_06330 [Magnetococcales bacterium]|nr:hypothetical protein [Magnetococcales bacterium]NGZ26487.1 hypothetical protein [Magnetococcales bacterium]
MSWGHLHLHTRASDGDIDAQAVRRAGLSFVAATDHDTLDGARQLQEVTDWGILLIPGIELSVRFSGRRFHVLVLEPQPAPGFHVLLEELQRQRREVIARLQECIRGEGLLTGKLISSRSTPTKREVVDAVWNHPANWHRLQTLGLANVCAMARYLMPPGDPVWRIPGVEAEEILPLIPGVLILAHPGKSLHLPEEASILESWVQHFPLVGLECVTRKHTAKEEEFCTHFAKAHGLVALTGNDVHDVAHLNTNRTPRGQWEQLRQRSVVT